MRSRPKLAIQGLSRERYLDSPMPEAISMYTRVADQKHIRFVVSPTMSSAAVFGTQHEC